MWHRLQTWLQDCRRRLRIYHQNRHDRAAKRLYLPTKSGKQRWRKLLLNLHPDGLYSFFTSKRGLWFLVKVGLVGFVLFSSLAIGAYFYYRQQVPATVLDLQSCLDAQTIKFYDRTGKQLLWTTRSGDQCKQIALKDISQDFLDAVISVEDVNFYEHPGYRVTSILRAALGNLLGQPTAGGSTITQQYIKNAVLKDSRRNFERKIREIILVPELENTFSKDEILTAYLNTVSFGSVYYGVEAAAQGYFGKKARNLTLDEAALLVAAMPAPNYFWEHPTTHLKHRDLVLDRMLLHQKITQAEYKQAKAEATLSKVKRERLSQQNDGQAPYYVLAAQRQLPALFCPTEAISATTCHNFPTSDLQIITNLDLKMQTLVEQTVAATLDNLNEADYDNAALVVIDNRNGQVLALNGGYDFQDPDYGQIDHLSQPHNPHQVWHPLLYATLLHEQSQWGAGRTLYDYPTFQQLPNPTPRGAVSLRQALQQSLLTPTAKVAYLATPTGINKLANKFELQEFLSCRTNCHIAHATTDAVTARLDLLANSYATFGRNGLHHNISYVRRVTNNHRDTLYRWERQPHRVLNEASAYMMNQILTDQRHRNYNWSLPANLGVKAGTSANLADNPIVAYNANIALGGWVGKNLKKQDSSRTVASTHRAQNDLISGFWQRYQPSRTYPFPTSTTVQQLRTDQRSGRIVATGGVLDYYAQAFAPNRLVKAVATIDSLSGKLATDCTPKRARQTQPVGNLIAELPLADRQYRTWMRPVWQALNIRLPSGRDDFHDCQDKPPQISFEQRGDCTQSCRLITRLKAGKHDLKHVALLANQKVVPGGLHQISGRSASVTYTYQHQQDEPVTLRLEVVDEGLYEAFVIVKP